MSEGPAFLDVNIPMYAAGREHPYREACVWVMGEIAEGRLAAAIDTEIIQEVLYRYSSLQRLDIAVKVANSLFDLVPDVYPVNLADARLVVTLFEKYSPQGIPVRDLVHLAVMQTNGISQIISTDEHFDRLEGVVRVDPLELYQREGKGRLSDQA